jgi:hypothetical protein
VEKDAIINRKIGKKWQSSIGKCEKRDNHP